MTTMRLVPGDGRRPRLRDGSLVPAEGIETDLDIDIHARRLHSVGDLVETPAEAASDAAASTTTAKARAAAAKD